MNCTVAQMLVQRYAQQHNIIITNEDVDRIAGMVSQLDDLTMTNVVKVIANELNK